jgi:hypothetical protein
MTRARITRRYDRASTPYQRVLALSDDRVLPTQKTALQTQYEALTPADALNPTLVHAPDLYTNGGTIIGRGTKSLPNDSTSAG